ncbi:hypothetical protein R3P38DRAFT_2512546 [Favolaschia claudopus]|uniref:Gag-like protein n=1 Tax=Favolaschia claudopus TaxID=2862362 RepID=A0AAW0CRL0_9AGAR
MASLLDPLATAVARKILNPASTSLPAAAQQTPLVQPKAQPAPRPITSQLEVILTKAKDVQADPLQGQSEEEICGLVENTLRDKYPEQFGPTFSLHGARKLGDGRVVLQACTEAEAGIIRERGNDWVPSISENLQVSRPSFTVIVHGVPADFLPGSWAGVCQLHNSNKMYIPQVADIIGIRWLHGNKGQHLAKSASSLVLSVSHEHIANQLIFHGTSVLRKLCRTEQFVPPPLQCFYCQGFNHIASVCPLRSDPSSLACARCAGNHSTKACSCPHSQCNDLRSCSHISVKCANCQGSHKSFDFDCPVKRAYVDSNRISRNVSGRYFGDFVPPAPGYGAGRAS